ncbi:MAG: hypothetical protein ACI9CD_001157 [Candidatus Deianiraeaceae bacterium]|jgi:hypothetical protein
MSYEGHGIQIKFILILIVKDQSPANKYRMNVYFKECIAKINNHIEQAEKTQ